LKNWNSSKFKYFSIQKILFCKKKKKKERKKEEAEDEAKKEKEKIIQFLKWENVNGYFTKDT
jgi:hypothetical protein